MILFQSTHPSGVRRVADFDRVAQQLISIHAPQWGATNRGYGLPIDGGISIHAPQWGATPRICWTSSSSRISIHAPQWGATHQTALRQFLCCISIHAPQWGATVGLAETNSRFRISIHAPQWGATARMGIAFHNTEAPSVLKTDFIAKIHVHRSIHKFSNQKHQQTIHF